MFPLVFPLPLPLPLPLPAAIGYNRTMAFAHERLDVYGLALDFLVVAHDVIERLPRGRGHLVDQLTRASTSIVLNIAEGAGNYVACHIKVSSLDPTRSATT